MLMMNESSLSAHVAPIVRLDAISAGYGQGPDVLAGASMSAYRGMVSCIVGVSGSGKTTLMHVMRLALPLREGAGMVLDADISRLTRTQRAELKQRIGYIAQEPIFIDSLSLFDNVAAPLEALGLKRQAYGDDVMELLNYVGLGAFFAASPAQLSTGQRRRAAIARALASKPDLILADEPTAGLSPNAAHRMLRLLTELRQVGAAIIITTPNEDLAQKAAEACWILVDGRLNRIALEADR
jgi:cell division transport system ATP-binding protein